MPTVRDLLENKGKEVWSVTPDIRIYGCAQLWGSPGFGEW
jgi:hypothetical protein